MRDVHRTTDQSWESSLSIGHVVERNYPFDVPKFELFRIIGMNYRWPLPHSEPVLDEALDIALGYLEATGQANAGDDSRDLLQDQILAGWLKGTMAVLGSSP